MESGVNDGIIKGTTIEATQICPKLASISEIVFNCSDENIHSQYSGFKSAVNCLRYE